MSILPISILALYIELCGNFTHLPEPNESVWLRQYFIGVKTADFSTGGNVWFLSKTDVLECQVNLLCVWHVATKSEPSCGILFIRGANVQNIAIHTGAGKLERLPRSKIFLLAIQMHYCTLNRAAKKALKPKGRKFTIRRIQIYR